MDRELIDVAGFAWEDAFEGLEAFWEVLPALERYLGALAGGLDGARVSGRADVAGEVSAGEGTVIEPFAVVRGPVALGRGCTIRSHAYVRGPCLIGDSCVVGAATELKGSVLFDGVSVRHHNYVGDSVMGRRVNLGAGVKLANLRLDRGLVRSWEGGAAKPTSLRKLGAVIGDEVQVGCNAVLNPGTAIGRGARVGPLALVGGWVEPGGVVR